MGLKVEWVEQVVNINQLKPYEKNPRRISKESFAKLKQSLAEKGLWRPIIATQDLRVIGGHQRIAALKQLGLKQIKVATPNIELSDQQFKEILVQDNLPFGEFDFDLLAEEFEAPELIELGMPENWLNTGEETEPEESEPKTIKDKAGFFCLVEFSDELEQQDFFNEMRNRGLPCKLMS